MAHIEKDILITKLNILHVFVMDHAILVDMNAYLLLLE